MKTKLQTRVILIGGAPTTGKSTMAELISERLRIPWISTDQIREIMRAAVRYEDVPKLFPPKGYTAEKFLKKFSAEEIVKMEMEQGEIVWPGVKTFIENDYTWENGFIVEGVSILPRLLAKDFQDKKDIKPVFLLDEDADRTRHVVFTRGLWDDACTYSDSVKEKEVEWSLLFGCEIKKEAGKHGYPCVEVTKNKDDVDAVLDALEMHGVSALNSQK